MKPIIFKTEAELVSFISRLPRVDGKAKVGGRGDLINAGRIIDRLKTIAPSIFRYKVVLAGSEGGLGSKKSVDRFSEVLGENLNEREVRVLEQAREALLLEVENLLGMGVSEETAEQLRSAKDQIAQVEKVKNIILGFKNKLQERMANVEKASAKMASSLDVVLKKEKSAELKVELKKVKEKLDKDLAEVRSLMESLNEYCDLQVAYNSIMIGAMAA